MTVMLLVLMAVVSFVSGGCFGFALGVHQAIQIFKKASLSRPSSSPLSRPSSSPLSSPSSSPLSRPSSSPLLRPSSSPLSRPFSGPLSNSPMTIDEIMTEKGYILDEKSGNWYKP